MQPSLLRPTHENQVHFDPYHQIKSSLIPHKTKSISIQTQNPPHIRPPFKKTSLFRSPHSISIPMPKPSDIRPAYQTHVIFDAHTKTKSVPIPTPKSIQVRTRTIKSSHFRPPTQQNVKFYANTKRCYFWPAYKLQVNYDHPHGN